MYLYDSYNKQRLFVKLLAFVTEVQYVLCQIGTDFYILFRLA
jgi:hypothetical protein